MRERTTATAIATAAASLGTATGFVAGPLLIPSNGDETLTDEERSDRSRRIFLYMWIQLAVCGVFFLAMLVYFPDRPANSPTVSATQSRENFVAGYKQLMRHKQFWILAVSSGIMGGVYSGWSSYLPPNLEQFISKDEAEDESGWIGFYSTVAGCISGIVIARIADTKGHAKAWMLLLTLGAAVSFTWFALVCINVLPRARWSYYLSSLVGGAFLSGATPIFYEAAVEATYPIAEGTCTSVVTTLNNVGCFIFLFVPDIPRLGELFTHVFVFVFLFFVFVCVCVFVCFLLVGSVLILNLFLRTHPHTLPPGNEWANWFLVGSCVFGAVLLLFYEENMGRTSIDNNLTRKVANGLQVRVER